MPPAAQPPGAHPFAWRALWRYGAMGFPLAFVALPLYVLLPNHYATAFGVSLTALGILLLGARLFDAFLDPLLGRWSDQLYAHAPHLVLRWAGVGVLLLALGFTGLFFPPVRSVPALLAWAAGMLGVTYVAFSGLGILHQSWGAMLGGDAVQRSRIVAWREGLGLLGVIAASIVPVALGLPALVAIFYIALVAAWWAWSGAPKPTPSPSAGTDSGSPAPRTPSASMLLPFTRPGFGALLAVFVANGIASAIPATLILFFVQDRLQAPHGSEALFLGVYFVCAALGVPLWLRLVALMGLAPAWALGMLLSVAAFVATVSLGAGDTMWFTLVCAVSGAGLGADLAIPGALLAGLIQSHGQRGRSEGAYFGWWNFANKLNLALAAGLALPLLGLWGYVPGTHDPVALQALGWAYGALPCALKLLALALLYVCVIRKELK